MHLDPAGPQHRDRSTPGISWGLPGPAYWNHHPWPLWDSPWASLNSLTSARSKLTLGVQVAEKGEAGSLGAWQLVDGGVYKSGDGRAGPYAEKDTHRGPTEPAEKPLTAAAEGAPQESLGYAALVGAPVTGRMAPRRPGLD